MAPQIISEGVINLKTWRNLSPSEPEESMSAIVQAEFWRGELDAFLFH